MYYSRERLTKASTGEYLRIYFERGEYSHSFLGGGTLKIFWGTGTSSDCTDGKDLRIRRVPHVLATSAHRRDDLAVLYAMDCVRACESAALRARDLEPAGCISTPFDAQTVRTGPCEYSGVPWTQTVILGSLDMSNRCIIAWYHRLGA